MEGISLGAAGSVAGFGDLPTRLVNGFWTVAQKPVVFFAAGSAGATAVGGAGSAGFGLSQLGSAEARPDGGGAGEEAVGADGSIVVVGPVATGGLGADASGAAVPNGAVATSAGHCGGVVAKAGAVVAPSVVGGTGAPWSAAD